MSASLCPLLRRVDVLQVRRAGDEGGGDRGGHDRDERDRLEHDERRDDASCDRLRRDVAVADGRHRLDRPPHADEDVRVLLVVEHAHEEPACDDDQPRRRDDHAGGASHRHRLAQEALHLPFEENDPGHQERRSTVRDRLRSSVSDDPAQRAQPIKGTGRRCRIEHAWIHSRTSFSGPPWASSSSWRSGCS